MRASFLCRSLYCGKKYIHTHRRFAFIPKPFTMTPDYPCLHWRELFFFVSSLLFQCFSSKISPQFACYNQWNTGNLPQVIYILVLLAFQLQKKDILTICSFLRLFSSHSVILLRLKHAALCSCRSPNFTEVFYSIVWIYHKTFILLSLAFDCFQCFSYVYSL